MLDCQGLLESIRNQIDSLYQIEKVGDQCLLVTPFLNADAAPIEIRLEQNGDSTLLIDDGEAFNYLFINGLTPESNADLLYQAELIANIYGVQLLDSMLQISVPTSQIGIGVQQLAASAQAISYLVYKRSHRPKQDFVVDVHNLLAVNSVEHETKFIVQGRANTHRVSFYINSGRNILLEPVSAATQSSARQQAKLVAYEWMDIGRVYGEQFKYNVILDDQNEFKRRLWDDKETISTLQSYSTNIYFWSDGRTTLLDALK